MPNAGARAATARPMRPRPTSPSCLPRSSDAEHEVERPALPLAPAHQALAFRQPPRDRQDQRPGEIGDRLGQHVRRVGDDDAARPRVGDVDVVVADGDVRDRLQRRRGVDDGPVDRVGEQADERVLAGHPRSQLVGRNRALAGVQIDVRDGAAASRCTDEGSLRVTRMLALVIGSAGDLVIWHRQDSDMTNARCPMPDPLSVRSDWQ